MLLDMPSHGCLEVSDHEPITLPFFLVQKAAGQSHLQHRLLAPLRNARDVITQSQAQWSAYG